MEMNIKQLQKFIERKKQKKIEVKLNELRKYADVKKKGNIVAYTVITATKGGMTYGITALNPGFCTRGHKHKNPYPEIYVLIQGKAKLVMKDKRKKIVDMKEGKILFVPEKSWHRVINKGKSKAKFITIHSAEVGHIYKK